MDYRDEALRLLKSLFIERCDKGEIKACNVPYVGCGRPFVKECDIERWEGCENHIDRIAYEPAQDEFYIHFNGFWGNEWVELHTALPKEEAVSVLSRAMEVEVGVKIIQK